MYARVTDSKKLTLVRMGKDDRNSEAPTQVAAVPRVFSIHCTVFLKNKICINQKEITYVNTGTGTSQVWALFMNLKKKSIIITSVMRVGSDTFGDPIFQNGLQNQPSSQIISVLGCFAQLCQLGAKCENWTFKVNFLCQKSSESLSFFFIEE